MNPNISGRVKWANKVNCDSNYHFNSINQLSQRERERKKFNINDNYDE